ncbi:MAG: hypothetical protein MI975_16945 [Cytophagales bacterium]|nr:hypothetical protein [Cytophagales bacterium]
MKVFRHLTSIAFLIHAFGSYGQTVNVDYLNPTSTSTNYDYARFGTSSLYYAGFMYNKVDTNYGDGDDFSIFTYGNRDLTFRTGLGNIIFFPTSKGKIGIGTKSPLSLVDINGGVSGDAILRIESDTENAGSETDNPRIEMYQDGQLIGAKIGFNEDTATPANHFQFDMIQPSGVIENALTINPYSGKIGLGVFVHSEDARLVVDGKIMAEEIRVQTVPASDYVFEPDYHLRSLSEVDRFIRENKHLPDVPSTEEFKQNGVGLGEMDDMLLRKIEELTLYVIELKKENEELRSRDKDHQQRIGQLERLIEP